MSSLVSVAVVAFVVTNLDDLVVLTAFCGHERYRFREVLLGQYLGFGALVGISLVGGMGVARLFAEHVRWLGVLPVVVGLVWYVRTRIARNAGRRVITGSTARSRTGLVAGVGFGDGADNIAVYVPLFAVFEPFEAMVLTGTFLVAAGVWVLFARWLAGRPLLAERLDEYGDTVLPAVLVALGIAILAGTV